MKFERTDLPEVAIIRPAVYSDARGYFMELYHKNKFMKANIDDVIVQVNLSASRYGVLRGLHYQHPKGQGKLVIVAQGSIYDVAVDIRRGSPRFGKWVGFELSDDNKKQVWIPPGFAHGICVLSDSATIIYKCTELYYPDHEHSILWNDPQLNITWPIDNPTVSDKDNSGKFLRDIDVLNLPKYDAYDKSRKTSDFEKLTC